MMTVSKGVLKARMLEFFRRIESTGEELIVTDNNRPVLKVVPFQAKRSPDEVFADVRGKLKVRESELLEPEWEEWGEG